MGLLTLLVACVLVAEILHLGLLVWLDRTRLGPLCACMREAQHTFATSLILRTAAVEHVTHAPRFVPIDRHG